MNGKTAKLIRRVAKKMGMNAPRHIRHMKRMWYACNKHERAIVRKELEEMIK